MSLDIGEVAALFHIHKAAMEHGEQFKHIRDAAMGRLREINEEHAPQKPDPVYPEPDNEIPEPTKDTPSGLEELVERRV